MKLPHYVRYTDSVKAGDARAFYVRINPKYKNDEGLHAHEYEHVKQWYLSVLIAIPVWCVIFMFDNSIGSFLLPLTLVSKQIAYKTIPALRFYLEVKAFRAQLKVYGYTPEFFEWAADALATEYNLNITKEQALARLKRR